MKECSQCKKYWKLYIETDDRLARIELARTTFCEVPELLVVDDEE